jgi:hypothetical protein
VGGILALGFLTGQLLLLLDHSFYAIIHVLNKVNLGTTKAAFI